MRRPKGNNISMEMAGRRQYFVFLGPPKKCIMLKNIILFLLIATASFAIQAQTLEMDQSHIIPGLRPSKLDPERFAGKVLVMVFWNTTDERCHEEFPEVLEMSNWYKNDKEVIFYAPTPDSPEQIERYLNGQNGNLRIVPNARDLVREYQVTSFPTYLVFDKKGKQSFSGRSNSTASGVKSQLFERIAELKAQEVNE